MEYEVANLQGLGRRERQEDSFAIVNAVDKKKISEQGLFFAVCDGMGGMANGALASQTAISSLRSSFSNLDLRNDIATQLSDSLFVASDKVEEVIGGGGGSTIVSGIIFNDRLYFASIGDSYLWLFRDGCLYRLNREMNLCHQNYMDDIRDGKIDPSDYQEQNDANALTSFAGMTGLSDVDCCIRPLELQSSDVIVACSDGVGGVLVEADVKSALSAVSVQDICKQIEQKLVDYSIPNQDNYTSVVVRCI